MTFRQLYRRLKDQDIDLDDELCIFDHEWGEYRPIEYFESKILKPYDVLTDVKDATGTKILLLY